MAPIMFKNNRSYMTAESLSLSIKSTSPNQVQQTCATKYSQYVSVGARIAPINCTNEKRMYNSRGQLIGKYFCVLKFT
jgi:hypothetical protein